MTLQISTRHLLAALLLLLVWTPAAGQGTVVFDSSEQELGIIEAQDVVHRTFRFVNAGDKAVTIARVDASCGCTIPSFTTEAVLPGASGEITVGFDPSGRVGPFRQSVYAVFEDGMAEPAGHALFVSGRVQPIRLPGGVDQGGVRFDAEVRGIGDAVAGEPHHFLMHRIGDGPLHILAAHSFPAGATIRYPQITIFHDDLVRIEILLSADMSTDPTDVIVALETDDVDEPIKMLRLVASGR